MLKKYINGKNKKASSKISKSTNNDKVIQVRFPEESSLIVSETFAQIN